MGERHKTVLAVSPDRQLARDRQDALTQAGFYVVSVHTEAAARHEIHFGPCGVLLLCHKLARRVREALARDFHRLCPEPFIVSVLAHERDHYPAQTHACVLHSHDLSYLLNTKLSNSSRKAKPTFALISGRTVLKRKAFIPIGPCAAEKILIVRTAFAA
jgi:hypothetical protein